MLHEVIRLPRELCTHSRVLFGRIQGKPSFACELPPNLLQVLDGTVEILSVVRICDPTRLALAKTCARPENLGAHEFLALAIVGLAEDEPLLAEAVIARAHRHRLAIAALEEFELPEVQRLADGVERDPLRVRLLQGRQYFGKGYGQTGCYLRVERTSWLRQLRDAVQNERICSRSGMMVRPAELLHRERQAVKSEKDIRTRRLHALRENLKIGLQLVA